MNPQTGERWSESTDYDQIAKDEKAKKRYEKALKYLIKSNKAKPNQPDTLNYLGFATRKLGDYKKGEEFATKKVPIKAPDEFDVREIEGRMDPHAMDIDWDANITSVDDAMSDLTELEAFAKKKSTKQIHKKKGTKPKDVFPDYDPGDYDID